LPLHGRLLVQSTFECTLNGHLLHPPSSHRTQHGPKNYVSSPTATESELHSPIASINSHPDLSNANLTSSLTPIHLNSKSSSANTWRSIFVSDKACKPITSMKAAHSKSRTTMRSRGSGSVMDAFEHSFGYFAAASSLQSLFSVSALQILGS